MTALKLCDQGSGLESCQERKKPRSFLNVAWRHQKSEAKESAYTNVLAAEGGCAPHSLRVISGNLRNLRSSVGKVLILD